MPYRRALVLAVLIFAVAAVPARAATVEVHVGGAGFTFNPATVTVNVGDTVRWTNDGGFHNVRANDGSFRCALGCDDTGGDGGASGAIWSFSRTFNQAGTVGYHCEEHGTSTTGMRGTVIVQGAGGGGTPAAPSNLQAVAQSPSEIELTWKDNSGNETGFRIERRTIGGTYQEVATTGANDTNAVIPGLDPATFYLFRVRAAGGGATNSAFSNEAGTATLGLIAPCVAGAEALCLNNGRFHIDLDWRVPGGTAGAGQAVPLPFAPDSGLFYFFSSSNLEMLIKVLNACVPPLGNKYWVFFSATTNVEFAVVVTDTQTGKTRGYYNPLSRPAPPVQDVSAFATCP